MERIKTNKEIVKIVENLIREEARAEALEILDKCSQARFSEFMQYYNNDTGDLCCLVLDIAKKELVDSGKMKHYKEDWYGSPWLRTTPKL